MPACLRIVPPSPYRTPAPPAGRPAPGAPSGSDDRELLPVFALAWVLCVARTALAIARAEAFGVEMTLVAAAVLVLPLLAKDGVVALLRRRPAGERRDGDP